MEEILVTFLVSVLAGVVSYYICKMAGQQTLDSNSTNGTAHRNEQESPQSCNSEGFCFFRSLHGISSHSLATVSIC